MSSTHLSLHVHVVFGTKARQPLIDAVWQDRLHAFIGGVAREAGATAEAIGGVADHVHLLLSLGSTTRLADLVRDIKRASSAWVHETIEQKAFAWQEGYGAFSVGAKDLDAVRAYIGNQAAHHRTRTFRSEYVAFLRRNGMPYDERFLD